MEQLVENKLFVLAFWFACLFLIEKIPFINIRQMVTAWHRRFWVRVGRNLFFYLFNGLCYPLVLIITVFASMHSLDWRADSALTQMLGFDIGGSAFFLPDILLNILLLDLMIYWWHRFNHIIPFLWRFHEIHHLDEMMDTTTAVRFHFGEVLLSAFNRAVFIILLDIPLVSVVIVETLLLMSALFHHANITLSKPVDRVLSLVMITPRIHNVHHHAIRRDTDSNYGNIFSFWDRIFKSYNARNLDKNITIGVEGARDQKILKLLLRPFR